MLQLANSATISGLNLNVPLGLPNTTPAAFLATKPSLVLSEIKSLSISLKKAHHGQENLTFNTPVDMPSVNFHRKVNDR